MPNILIYKFNINARVILPVHWFLSICFFSLANYEVNENAGKRYFNVGNPTISLKRFKIPRLIIWYRHITSFTFLPLMSIILICSYILSWFHKNLKQN